MPCTHLRQRNGNNADIESFMQLLERHQVSREQALQFLNSLKEKELDCNAILSFVRCLRVRSPGRLTSRSSAAVNIVGTGGGRSTFNISTTAAFVAAAAGAVVVKSGSTGYASRCGSYDLLKTLGINVNISYERFERMVADIGIGFVNPGWYAPILRRLAVTILPQTFKTAGGFINTIGPLLSPIDVSSCLIGVKSKALIDIMATCVYRLGISKAVVCWSDLGLDEFCSIGNNYFRRVTDAGIATIQKDAADPVSENQIDELKGGSVEENAAITQSILDGSIKGVKLNTVLRNAAYCLMLGNISETVGQGLKMAAEAIYSGNAMIKLDQARQFSTH